MMPRKKKAPAAPKQSAAAYEKQKARTAATQAEKSRAGRDVAGDFPVVVNPERKAAAVESLEFFCRTYLPKTFYLPWSPDHRTVIAKIEGACRHGGLFAVAMPRGSGKTALAVAGAIWAILSGYQQYVVLLGSTEPAATSMLDSVRREFETNESLYQDWPEVCHPIRRLEGIAHRANGQLFNGKRTYIEWTAKEIVLPTIDGSKAGGAIIQVAGITGQVRGMNFTRPDGGKVRPGLVIADDPQTDESAKSPTQCNDREEILEGAVQGLAGPGREIAIIMPITVIRSGDLADRYLSRKIHPEYQGERTKMLYEDWQSTDERWQPREDLWKRYQQVKADGLASGDRGKAANEFYVANREAMDGGLRAAWPARHRETEISAIQHAMNIKLAKPAAFAAEYQNEPLVEGDDEAPTVTPDHVAKQLNHFPRGIVPSKVTRLTAFIDVQGDLLYWAVCGFEDEFKGYVIDYGSFPDQSRSYFTLRDAKRTLKAFVKAQSFEQALRKGLELLTQDICGRQWVKEDESTLKIARCPIDANWETSKDVVYKFCRESQFSGVVIPNHGRGYGAKGNPFSEYKPKRGERKGTNWRETLTPDRPVQKRLITDINHWKSFAHERLAVPVDGGVSLSLFGDSPEDHRMFADQVAGSEIATLVHANGRSVVEWNLRPAKPDNHLFDCLVGCFAAAAERGAMLKETAREQPAKKKAYRASERQKT